MLSKEERKERNTMFWDAFRKEMRKTPSSTGRNIDWINYPSQVKDVYIRMETSGNKACFCIDIQPKDDGIRALIYEQMTELKRLLESEMGEATWNEFDRVFTGRNVSRISWCKEDLNFYQDEDLSEIRAFFKEKLISFDRFYQEYKDILLALVQ
ncbi:MAG: DUF4268 domain-containing protein [Bacteroidetes bacterium]|nr:MAG: DUF4268 domain-containing protein [Bacteroidota bacterium]